MSDIIPNSASWSIPRNNDAEAIPENPNQYFSDSNWARTYKHARALTQNPADAEDMAQEAYLRLFQAISAGQKIKSCMAWLKVVVRNATFQYWHETRPALHIAIDAEVNEEEGIAATLEDPSSSIEETLIDENLVRESLRVLAELPAAERECIMMYARGYTFTQIAKAQGISYKIAIKITRKALIKTRRRIDPQCGNEVRK